MVLAGLLALTVIGLALVTVPYYAIAPGSARPVGDRVLVEGVETYDTEGEVEFVTVSVPKLSALGAALGWLDPNADVLEEERLLGDRTRDENRQENLRLMGYSKDFATYVALSELGFRVTVRNGGVAVDSLCMQQATDGSCATESPASQLLDPGDLVVEIDGQPVNLAPDISKALAGKQPGDEVEVRFRRDGDEQTGTVVLTGTDDGRTILGIIPNPSPPDTVTFEFPFEVTIDSGQVGGPSAGLAFTLALLDTLTPGSLTGGSTVAATGTISPTGAVGDIGGLRQKTVAVARSGAEVFLVPINEESIAKEAAEGTGVEVIGVADLQDALEALAARGGNSLALGKPGAQPPG